jgi:hypothetical protein
MLDRVDLLQVETGSLTRAIGLVLNQTGREGQ